MARLLLTQSQVSVIISSGVVLLFTFFLFLSGYILQQQTVQGLQATIRPRVPSRPSPVAAPPKQPNPALQPSRLFRRHRDGSHVAYLNLNRDIHAAENAAAIDWTRRAHIQLVRRHRDVCNALMVLAELHRQRSPARRVLLFPHAWAEERPSARGEIADPFLDSSRRLLRRAARRYGVELRPVRPIGRVSRREAHTGEMGGEGEGGNVGEEEAEEELYSLASAFALQAEFDRVMVVETPGLLLDAEPLDAVLGFTESAPLAMLRDSVADDGVHAEDLFLLEPSERTFEDLVERLRGDEAVAANDTDFSSFFSDPLLLASSSEENALIRSVGILHEVDAGFNRTAFLSDVSYIRFSDPKIPGPEYEIPWSQKRAARPKNNDADWVWTSLYGDFAQKRLDICGLDLESYRP